MSVLLSLYFNQRRNAFGAHSFRIRLVITAILFYFEIIKNANETVCAFLVWTMVDTIVKVQLHKFVKGYMLNVSAFYLYAVNAFLVLCVIAFSFLNLRNKFFLLVFLTQRTFSVRSMIALTLSCFLLFVLLDT